MSRSRLISLLFLSLSLAAAMPARALPLTPMVGGIFTNGDGANSRWVQVTDDWRGSLYGDAAWGTGIWGLADHAAVMGLGDGDTGVVQMLDTRVEQINFADQHFIDAWGTSWIAPRLAPIFRAGGGQDNWAARFWGYLAITEPGAYNFGILYDDGFRFTLFGAGGAAQRIEVDGLNPRDRLGFAEDLWLSPGLYAYQLDAYDRLEAGAVQLAWTTPGGRGWSVVPQAALFTRAIPEPPLPLLLLAGLIAAGLATRQRG